MKSKFLWVWAFLSPMIFLLVVLILGFITPEYSSIQHTISRLAIGKYGYIQQLNFIQFGLGFIVSGYLFSRFLSHSSSKQAWSRIFYLCAAFAFIEMLFPTNKMYRFTLSALTPGSVIHFGAMGIFFLLVPLGVRALCQSLRKEPKLRHLTRFTAIIGYSMFLLCIFWSVIFMAGYFLPYLGLIQKLIALMCLYWLETMLWSIRPSLKIPKYSLNPEL